MNASEKVRAVKGDGAVSAPEGKAQFGHALMKREYARVSGIAPPGLEGPATLSRDAIVKGSHSPTLPDDDDDTFLVVEDVSTAISDTGEEVAVVSGETVEGAEAALAVARERGDALVVSLPERDHLGNSIPGSVFASMLIDQRSGFLPSPFSLMRLAEAANPDGAPSPPVDETAVEDVAADAALGQELGREMSRSESPIAQLEQRINYLLGILRARISALPFFGGPPRQ